MYDKITTLLSEKYNISNTIPGQKIDCPECKGAKCCRISENNQIVKCFRSTCSFILIVNKSPLSGFQHILHTIYGLSKKELKTTCKNEAVGQSKSNAYYYLTKTRNINPEVINKACIGVINKECSEVVESLYKKQLNMIEQKIKESKIKKQKDFLKEQLIFANDRKKNLHDIMSNSCGWIAFFYTDPITCEILQIRLRKPNSKFFKSFKLYPGTKKNGVFGLETYFFSLKNRQKEVQNIKQQTLIVFEGEFNMLALQSLLIEKTNNVSPLIACGASSNYDYYAIRNIDKTPTLFYDNDSSGESVLEEAKKYMNFYSVTTPDKAINDIDEYIQNHKTDSKCLQKILHIIKGRKLNLRCDKYIIKNINKLRNEKIRAFECNQKIFDFVFADIIEFCDLYFDNSINQFYLFNKIENKIVVVDGMTKKSSISKNSFSYMLTKYGINPTEDLCSYINAQLKCECYRKGNAIEAYKLSYFDAKNNILYLHDLGSKIYKVTKDNITIHNNGVDGILFLPLPETEPFKLNLTGDRKNILDDKLLNILSLEKEDDLENDERRLLIKCWLISVFFESILITKAILAFVGVSGSGKTSFARSILKLFMGKHADVTSINTGTKSDDFDAVVTNSHIAAFDNADSPLDWLCDRLCICATGGKISKRKLYNDNINLNYIVKCFLMITSRSPYFKREDVANRLLIMKVEKLNDTKFKKEDTLMKEVLENRNNFLTELVYEAQKIIKIRAENSEDEHVCHRLGDYADLCVKYGKAINKEKYIRDIFRKLQKSQNKFSIETDTLYDLLDIWIDEKNPAPGKEYEKNEGREIKAKDLFVELNNLAYENSMKLNYKNQLSLAMKLNQIKPNLEEYFIMTKEKDRTKTTMYTFKKKPEDAKIETDEPPF